MKLSHKHTRLLPLVATLLILPLAACGGGNSSSESSDSSPSIVISDITIEEKESIDLYDYVEFYPEGSEDTINFVITSGDDVVTITESGYLTGLKEGVANVTGTTDSTNLSDSFTVSVTAALEPETTPWEQFNADGSFEAEDALDRFNLTGPTASLQTIEADSDSSRNHEGLALKLWTGDYQAATDETPEVSSLVDFSLGYTFTDDTLVAGTYTLEFDIVGALSTLEAEVNGTTYSWANGDLTLNGSKYVTNYVVFEQTSATFELELKFFGANGDVNWGYVDDIKLVSGNQKPEIPQVTNLLSDGSFEELGTVGGDFSLQSIWELTGTPGTNDWGANLKIDSSGANDGSYGINYWHGSSTEDDFTIAQTISVTAGTYVLSYDIYGGDYSQENSANTTISVLQEETIVASEFISPSGTYATITLPDLSLVEGEVTIAIRIQTTASNTWIKLDNFVLTAKQ